jgi:hypothetical protein
MHTYDAALSNHAIKTKDPAHHIKRYHNFDELVMMNTSSTRVTSAPRDSSNLMNSVRPLRAAYINGVLPS